MTAPSACLHAGCHPGRCVYGPDHGQPNDVVEPRGEQQLRAELGRLQAEYDRAGERAAKYWRTSQLVRIETLKWVLGQESMFDDERR